MRIVVAFGARAGNGCCSSAASSWNGPTTISTSADRLLFRGAVKGVVIQQVQVLPEELAVHLGSYGAGAAGNRHD